MAYNILMFVLLIAQSSLASLTRRRDAPALQPAAVVVVGNSSTFSPTRAGSALYGVRNSTSGPLSSLSTTASFAENARHWNPDPTSSVAEDTRQRDPDTSDALDGAGTVPQDPVIDGSILSSARACASQLTDYFSSKIAWDVAHTGWATVVIASSIYSYPLVSVPSYIASSRTTLCDGHPRVVGAATVVLQTLSVTETVTATTRSSLVSGEPPFPTTSAPCSIAGESCQALYDTNKTLVSLDNGFGVCDFDPDVLLATTSASLDDSACLGACAITASAARLLYWPIRSKQASPNFCDDGRATTTGLVQTGRTVNSYAYSGVTITSPSVAVALAAISRVDGCGSTSSERVIVLRPDQISSMRAGTDAYGTFESLPFDYQHLNYVCPYSSVSNNVIAGGSASDCYQDVPAAAYFGAPSAVSWGAAVLPQSQLNALTIGPDYTPEVVPDADDDSALGVLARSWGPACSMLRWMSWGAPMALPLDPSIRLFTSGGTGAEGRVEPIVALSSTLYYTDGVNGTDSEIRPLALKPQTTINGVSTVVGEITSTFTPTTTPASPGVSAALPPVQTDIGQPLVNGPSVGPTRSADENKPTSATATAAGDADSPDPAATTECGMACVILSLVRSIPGTAARATLDPPKQFETTAAQAYAISVIELEGVLYTATINPAPSQVSHVATSADGGPSRTTVAINPIQGSPVIFSVGAQTYRASAASDGAYVVVAAGTTLSLTHEGEQTLPGGALVQAVRSGIVIQVTDTGIATKKHPSTQKATTFDIDGQPYTVSVAISDRYQVAHNGNTMLLGDGAPPVTLGDVVFEAIAGKVVARAGAQATTMNFAAATTPEISATTAASLGLTILAASGSSYIVAIHQTTVTLVTGGSAATIAGTTMSADQSGILITAGDGTSTVAAPSMATASALQDLAVATLSEGSYVIAIHQTTVTLIRGGTAATVAGTTISAGADGIIVNADGGTLTLGTSDAANAASSGAGLAFTSQALSIGSKTYKVAIDGNGNYLLINGAATKVLQQGAIVSLDGVIMSAGQDGIVLRASSVATTLSRAGFTVSSAADIGSTFAISASMGSPPGQGSSGFAVHAQSTVPASSLGDTTAQTSSRPPGGGHIGSAAGSGVRVAASCTQVALLWVLLCIDLLVMLW